MSKGFTLIELMVTLSILSILMGYGLPSLKSFTSKQKLETERNRLMVDMSFARNYAVHNQTFVVICPSTSGKACDASSNWHKGWVVFADQNKDRDIDNNDIVLRYENLPMDQITALSSLSRGKIRFNTIGHSPGTNVSIQFCSTNDKHSQPIQLVINNGGRIKQSKSTKDCSIG